jgi:hypothetical protein
MRKFVFVRAYDRDGYSVSAHTRLAYCLPNFCRSPDQFDFGF